MLQVRYNCSKDFLDLTEDSQEPRPRGTKRRKFKESESPKLRFMNQVMKRKNSESQDQLPRI